MPLISFVFSSWIIDEYINIYIYIYIYIFIFIYSAPVLNYDVLTSQVIKKWKKTQNNLSLILINDKIGLHHHYALKTIKQTMQLHQWLGITILMEIYFCVKCLEISFPFKLTKLISNTSRLSPILCTWSTMYNKETKKDTHAGVRHWSSWSSAHKILQCDAILLHATSTIK